MAFYNDEEEEGLDSGQPVQTSASGGVIGEGGGSSSGNAQSSNGPAGAAGAPDKPGNFVGLKTYLDANKNQSSKLGDQVSGYASSNDAAQGIAELGSKFNEKVQQGSLSNLDAAEDEGKNIVNQAATTGQLGADQQARYKEIANASYKGPNTLQDAADVYNPAYAKVTDAQKKADLTNTEGGQQQLLKDMNGNPVNYTAGANRFDSYLLNSDQNKGKLQGVRDQAGALTGALTAQEQAAANAALAAKNKTDVTRDSILKAFGRFDDPSTPNVDESQGALGSYAQGINQKLTDAQAAGQALSERVRTGGLTNEDLSRFGLTNQSTYGTDIGGFYNPGVATAAGVTDASDKARYDALMSLGGDGPGLYGGSTAADFGAYNPTVNTQGFNQSIAENKKLYEETKPLQLAKSLLEDMTGKFNNPIANKFMDQLRNAKTVDEISAALGEIDQQEKHLGVNIDALPGRTALRQYLTQTLPAIRTQGLSGPTGAGGKQDGQPTGDNGLDKKKKER